MTTKIDFSFETSGIHGKYSNNHCTEGTYQRNGVSGIGFTVIKFRYEPTETEGGKPRDMLGIVFEGTDKAVAVIDPEDLDAHWRGDVFEDGLRQAAKVFQDAWSAEIESSFKGRKA